MSARRHPQCHTCQRPDRSQLELELAASPSIRAIATRHGIAYHLLHKHWKYHVSPERKANLVLGPVQRAALSARICEESSSVLDHYKVVRSGLYELYQSALEVGDRQGGQMLAGRLHENLAAIARLTGQLAASPLIANTTINNVLIKGHVITGVHEAARAWGEIRSDPALDLGCLEFRPAEPPRAHEAAAEASP